MSIESSFDSDRAVLVAADAYADALAALERGEPWSVTRLNEAQMALLTAARDRRGTDG